ncbi:MAG: hypothetical protein GAK35_01065 [Herbaspirillum frisingense]|uniref:Uncharacterized protein n=1 Tax=Herbaspirillum frisingense TaxID=92645 RepID=A0A7V8FYU1_9BURK|nr:MAG: hypothetical protein GAK35_01065 [Herbaspirillum frisingense]
MGQFVLGWPDYKSGACCLHRHAACLLSTPLLGCWGSYREPAGRLQIERTVPGVPVSSAVLLKGVIGARQSHINLHGAVVAVVAHQWYKLAFCVASADVLTYCHQHKTRPGATPAILIRRTKPFSLRAVVALLNPPTSFTLPNLASNHASGFSGALGASGELRSCFQRRSSCLGPGSSPGRRRQPRGADRPATFLIFSRKLLRLGSLDATVARGPTGFQSWGNQHQSGPRSAARQGPLLRRSDVGAGYPLPAPRRWRRRPGTSLQHGQAHVYSRCAHPPGTVAVLQAQRAEFDQPARASGRPSGSR